MKKYAKQIAALSIGMLVLASGVSLTGCGGKVNGSEEVVISSNADEEAIGAIKKALDNNGYEGKYIVQSLGTSELGGKLMAEGTNLEADLVTMSSYYVDSAQAQNKMFRDLTFERNTMAQYPEYYAPITAQEGTIILNTEMMKEYNLSAPASIKDLAKPEYAGYISVTDIQGSSTAWLLIQALVSEYGDGAKEILTKIYDNAGDHLEESGSGPIKKVRAGEVAIGFGLRQQAAADKKAGLPIDYVDPSEGNFTLTESVAVVDKGESSNELAMEMAECIVQNARAEIITYYPIPIYQGEKVDSENMSAKSSVFNEPLTVDLLKKHQTLSESCK